MIGQVMSLEALRKGAVGGTMMAMFIETQANRNDKLTPYLAALSVLNESILSIIEEAPMDFYFEHYEASAKVDLCESEYILYENNECKTEFDDDGCDLL